MELKKSKTATTTTKKETKKRARTDTFWNFSDEENGQLFDAIFDGKNKHYELKQELSKLDYHGRERTCWRIYSKKTGNPADNVRSTKPYRLGMLWSVYTVPDFWSPKKRDKVISQLPLVLGKRGEHHRHRCGNDWCCNPSHISIGSRTSNEVDKHFHYFLNHESGDVRDRFLKTFPDLMKKQRVW